VRSLGWGAVVVKILSPAEELLSFF